MDRCDKCLKTGNIKKIKIQGNPTSEALNFNSELHLCNECYKEFCSMFDVNEIQNGVLSSERELLIYLQNMPEEGQEKVFNHFAYGPYIKYKRPKDWIRDNRNCGNIYIPNRKKILPKGKKVIKSEESQCPESFYIRKGNKDVLCCPLHEELDGKLCELCSYKNKNQIQEKESESKDGVHLREKPKGKAKSQRDIIGSLEFGYPEK